MADQSIYNNPYTPFAPASNGRLFFGREAVFEWIQQALVEKVSGQPLVLRGPAHIGKTSILKQIEAGRLGPQFFSVYVDLNAVVRNSESAFLWEVAHTVVLALTRQYYDFPRLNQTDFVADPLKAFGEWFLKPALTALNDRTLLFLFDNLDAFTEQVPAAGAGQDMLHALYDLIDSYSQVDCIFVMVQPGNEAQPSRPFLQNARLYEVGRLTGEAATALVRQPVSYTIVKDVAQYIVDLTNGSPYEVQRLCHALYERQQRLNLSQITVADVAALKMAAPDIHNGPTTAAGSPVYNLKSHSSLAQTIHRVGWRYNWQRSGLLIIIATLLVLIMGVAFLPTITGQGSRPQPDSAISNRPTAIALAAFAETSVRDAVSVSAVSSTVNALAIGQPSATPTPGQTATETATATATMSPTPSPTLSPTPSRYPPVSTRTQDNMPMILIPAGSFLMGSAEDDFIAASDERPQHEVMLDRFYIDKYEVSVAQYAAFLNRLGSYERACDRLDCALPKEIAGYTSYLSEQDLGDGTIQYVPVTGYANYPVNHVSWYGATAYCEWVDARLPTEAEWEYAARGDDGRLYPWGNSAPAPDRAVFQSESFDNLKTVDALPNGASPFGIFGMAGSLWEWTADWYDEAYYSISPARNPSGPETGFSRVIRGGAWPNNNQADRIRAANRSSLSPDFLSATVGFRCARTP